jgi:hypothetical protein
MRSFSLANLSTLLSLGILICSVAPADTLYYAGSFVYDSNPNANHGGFHNNAGFASASDSFQLPSNVSNSPSDPGGVEHVVTSANLSAGSLHAQSDGSIFITQTPGSTTSFFTLAESFLGDTFTVSGAGVGGGHLQANLTVDGSFSYFDPASGSTYTNGSFFEIYIDPVGSFDGPYTPYAAYFYGIGSDFCCGYPPNATYMGTVNPGATVPVVVPLSLLGAARDFQVAVGLGTGVYGNGAPGFAWNADFGNTLTVTFQTDPDITLTSKGGFAGTAVVTPEPATFWMAGLFGLMLAARKSPSPRRIRAAFGAQRGRYSLKS